MIKNYKGIPVSYQWMVSTQRWMILPRSFLLSYANDFPFEEQFRIGTTLPIPFRWKPKVLEDTLKRICFLKNGPNSASFSFIFVFSNEHHYNFFNK